MPCGLGFYGNQRESDPRVFVQLRKVRQTYEQRPGSGQWTHQSHEGLSPHIHDQRGPRLLPALLPSLRMFQWHESLAGNSGRHRRSTRRLSRYPGPAIQEGFLLKQTDAWRGEDFVLVEMPLPAQDGLDHFLSNVDFWSLSIRTGLCPRSIRN